MHEQPSEFVGIALQAEENAQAHIVDARFHRAVVRFGVVGVVALRSRGMKFLIALFVVGLLKQDIGTDLGFLELAVVLDRGSCDVHVRATDRAVLVLDRVDGLKALEHVLDRIVDRVFAQLDRKALVTLVLQRNHFGGDLFLGELLARDRLVLQMVRAVHAAVHAVIRQVERREEHDAIAVMVVLDRARQREDALDARFVFAGQKHARFAVGEPVPFGGFLEDAIDEREVGGIAAGSFEGCEDLFVVDEFFRVGGGGIIGRGSSGHGLFCSDRA